MKMIELDNNSLSTQPSAHLVSLKTETTDPVSFLLNSLSCVKENTYSGL